MAAKKIVEGQIATLPSFTYSEFTPIVDDPEPVEKLRREIHALERQVALVQWWQTARPAFSSEWSALIGKKQEDGTFRSGSVEGKLSVLERALAHARPLDDLSKHLSNAATLEPLKALRGLYAPRIYPRPHCSAHDAKTNNDDATARDYIRKVRIYCEDLIKFMLRSISNTILDMTLNQLKEVSSARPEASH